MPPLQLGEATYDQLGKAAHALTGGRMAAIFRLLCGSRIRAQMLPPGWTA